MGLTAYTTSTVRDIFLFAVFFLVSRPFCRFTLVYEGRFMLCYKEKLEPLDRAMANFALFWLTSIASYVFKSLSTDLILRDRRRIYTTFVLGTVRLIYTVKYVRVFSVLISRTAPLKLERHS